MNYQRFNEQCLGIIVKDWPFPLIGIFYFEDEEWGRLDPIPEKNPLSKTWKYVDSEMYFKFEELKLIKIIKHVETKQNTTSGGFSDKDSGKSAVG